MLGEEIQKSNIIELVEEDTADPGVYQATIRVLKEREWLKMVVDLLEVTDREEGFDLEPRKSYWWHQDLKAVRFSWVVLVWGDLEAAEVAIGDILSRRLEPKPAPPQTADPRKRPSKPTRLTQRRVQMDDGETRVITTAPLPHAQPGRYQGDPHQVVKVTDGKGQRVRAVVGGRSESEFSAKRQGEGVLHDD